MSLPVEHFGPDPDSGRELLLCTAQASDPDRLFEAMPTGPFVCLLVWDTAAESVAAIANVTDEGAVANLRAPLIINVQRRSGVQVILDDPRHDLRAPVRLEAATVS